MDLADLLNRPPPVPWRGKAKIPWHEAAFSERMLREHLDQAHGMASRPYAVIDRQVAWIHDEMLGGKAQQILDLGCGPGLYSSRLAKLGHACVGIDFSPASIGYARNEAETAQLSVEYRLADIRTADYGAGYGVACFLFGEFNAFSPDEIGPMLDRVRQCLEPSGLLIVECHEAGFLEEHIGRPPSWYLAEKGLFSARPHLCLQESHWHPDARAASDRYYVIDCATSKIDEYVNTLKEYNEQEYDALFVAHGFHNLRHYPSLTGEPSEPGLNVIIATR